MGPVGGNYRVVPPDGCFHPNRTGLLQRESNYRLCRGILAETVHKTLTNWNRKTTNSSFPPLSPLPHSSSQHSVCPLPPSHHRVSPILLSFLTPPLPSHHLTLFFPFQSLSKNTHSSQFPPTKHSTKSYHHHLSKAEMEKTSNCLHSVQFLCLLLHPCNAAHVTVVTHCLLLSHRGGGGRSGARLQFVIAVVLNTSTFRHTKMTPG